MGMWEIRRHQRICQMGRVRRPICSIGLLKLYIGNENFSENLKGSLPVMENENFDKIFLNRENEGSLSVELVAGLATGGFFSVQSQLCILDVVVVFFSFIATKKQEQCWTGSITHWYIKTLTSKGN
ncbi:hypothetical protein P3L10_001655 [Capsicum annuum]